MRFLVLGSGGREHAIVWKLAQSALADEIHVIPGNPGMAEIAITKQMSLSDHKGIIAYALDQQIDLVIVGPEQPLVDGIADTLRDSGIKVFGPGESGARLEGSKIFSKEFMVRNDILTAPFGIYDSKVSAVEGLKGFTYPLVIKVDGLAAGKGVLIPKNYEEALRDLEVIFDEGKFGEAGDRVLIEQFVSGFEASILCLVDDEHIIALESARDYKKALDGDLGLNTGGMGTISPNDKLSEHLSRRIENDVLKKTLDGLKKEGIPFNGVIFIGLIIDEAGTPFVLEYNVRFGDPETQSVLARLTSDLGEAFVLTVENRLDELQLTWDKRMAVTVVLASGGYPEAYEKGKAIEFGYDPEAVTVFHAGTKEVGGKILTNGGRVLGITGLGDDKDQIRKSIYENIEKINFEGKMFRTDIGL
jgi:phosphoribosylamine--glycine ligase